MTRLVSMILFLSYVSPPTLAYVETIDFTSTLRTEKASLSPSSCRNRVRYTGFDSPAAITELEDCGVQLVSEYSMEEIAYTRLDSAAISPYGVSALLFNRRLPLPLFGTKRPREGAGISVSMSLLPALGTTSVTTSISLVERLPAPTSTSSKPAVLTLDVYGNGMENFSAASVKVFDHDTDELLLTWSLDDPLEPNNGVWNSQEINFDDRVGHAIRYEFEADATALPTSTSTTFATATFLNLPEPASPNVAWLSMLVILSLRRKKRA